MTSTEINKMLYRPLSDGRRYDHLFPDSTCVSTHLATGNTKVAINEMAKWAKKYVDHTTQVAKVLQGDDLEDTVDNIQNFLYNHFQYRIDESDQLLRSPGCAWHQRKEGIDCKSYSIIASTLLLNLGIKHYLRRIKQTVMPEVYTHVYVVIPNDQSTGKLNDDYFIIDGTVQENIEVPFVQSDDLFMSEPKLAIHGLAGGLNCNCNDTYGMGVDFPVIDIPDQEQEGEVEIDSSWFAKTWGDVKGFFGDVFLNGFDLSCINTTFQSNETELDVKSSHIPYLEYLLGGLSAQNKASTIEANLNYLSQYIANSHAYFAALRSVKNWRNCSRNALNVYVNFYADQLDKAQELANSLKSYYKVEQVTMTAPVTRAELFNNDGIGSDVEEGQSYEYQVYTLIGSTTGGGNSEAGGGIGTMLIVGGVAAAIYFSNKKSK